MMMGKITMMMMGKIMMMEMVMEMMVAMVIAQPVLENAHSGPSLGTRGPPL